MTSQQIAGILFDALLYSRGQKVTKEEREKVMNDLVESTRKDSLMISEIICDRFSVEPRCPFINQYSEHDKKIIYRDCPFQQKTPGE